MINKCDLTSFNLSNTKLKGVIVLHFKPSELKELPSHKHRILEPYIQCCEMKLVSHHIKQGIYLYLLRLPFSNEYSGVLRGYFISSS